MSKDKQESRSFLVNLIKLLRNTLFHFLNAIASNKFYTEKISQYFSVIYFMTTETLKVRERINQYIEQLPPEKLLFVADLLGYLTSKDDTTLIEELLMDLEDLKDIKERKKEESIDHEDLLAELKADGII